MDNLSSSNNVSFCLLRIAIGGGLVTHDNPNKNYMQKVAYKNKQQYEVIRKSGRAESCTPVIRVNQVVIS